MILQAMGAALVIRVSYKVIRSAARGSRVLAREWRDELYK